MADAVIGALRVNLGIDSAQFSSGLKGAQDRLHSFKAVAAGALAAVAGAAAAAAVGLGIAVKGAITAADEMGKAAQKFGVPVEALSRLKYAAEMSNVAFDTLGTGLRKLAQGMDDAANGGMSSAADAFARLGIAVQNVDGTFRTQEDVLGQIAARFQELPDGAQKTALAMDIFGKSGAELIPLLNEGADGIRRLTDEASALGLTIGGDTAAVADSFNDNLDRMRAIWDGLVTQLAAKLLPHLERLSVVLLNFARDQAQVEGAMEAITNGFKWVIETATLLAVRIGALGETFNAFWNAVSSPFDQSGWDKLGSAIDANKAKMASAREELAKLWQTSPDQRVAGAFDAFGTAPAGAAAGGGAVLPGRAGGGSSSAEAEQERLDAQLERLRMSLMTEEEAEFASYQKRLAQLAEFQNARVVSDQDAASLRGQIERDHNDHMAEMQEQRLNDFASTIGSVGSILGSLTKIMGTEGDKQLGLMKALSLAEGLINVYTGITAALRLPFPANIAAAASVAASGFATLASMRTVSKSSAGGSKPSFSTGGGGEGASAGAAAGSSGPGQTLFISGINPSSLYSGDALNGLMKALVEKQRDGYQLVYGQAS